METAGVCAAVRIKKGFMGIGHKHHDRLVMLRGAAVVWRVYNDKSEPIDQVTFLPKGGSEFPFASVTPTDEILPGGVGHIYATVRRALGAGRIDLGIYRFDLAMNIDGSVKAISDPEAEIVSDIGVERKP